MNDALQRKNKNEVRGSSTESIQIKSTRSN